MLYVLQRYQAANARQIVFEQRDAFAALAVLLPDLFQPLRNAFCIFFPRLYPSSNCICIHQKQTKGKCKSKRESKTMDNRKLPHPGHPLAAAESVSMSGYLRACAILFIPGARERKDEGTVAYTYTHTGR